MAARTVAAILIDPDRRTINYFDLPREPSAHRAEMLRIVGGGMDYAVLSDMKDTLWAYEFGLIEHKPVYAFKLPVLHDPCVGKAVVLGETDDGSMRRPCIPIELLRRDVEWLGLIVPQVDWIEEQIEMHGKPAVQRRAIVTYSRPK
jgi:hypothetical protein